MGNSPDCCHICPQGLPGASSEHKERRAAGSVYRERRDEEVFTKTGELQEVFTERASSLWALSWGCFMLIRGFNSWLCCCSIVQWCLPLFDPMDCSTPGCPVLHHLWEFAQTHVHQVSDTIQPSHPLSTPSLPALNLSQHQDIFQ